MVQDTATFYNDRPIISRIMIYRTAPFSTTLKDPILPSSRSCLYLMLNISETLRDTDIQCSFNGILIGTYTRHDLLKAVISNDLE